MAIKNRQHVAKTIHYRDYCIKSNFPIIVRNRTHKFELYWTPKGEDWDEHYICTYEVPEKYTITPTFVGQRGDDGRMRILLKLQYGPMRASLQLYYFELELLLLPVEREDGSLHLAVVSAGSQCAQDYADAAEVKRVLDHLISTIENHQ